MEGTTSTPQKAVDRRNYWLFVSEGGLFIGAIAFVSPESVAPKMVEALGGPRWLVSLAPALMMIGFMLPQIFTAHWIERLPRLRPFLMTVGFIQRLPLLLAAVALGLFYTEMGEGAVFLAALAPLFVGLIGGLLVNAWLELFAAAVPPQRRASASALRNVVGALLGLAAGTVVNLVLRVYPGADGYALLYLIAFVVTMISLATFSRIHEAPRQPNTHDENPGILGTLRAMPSRLAGPSVARQVLWVHLGWNGQFLILPFLAIYALDVTGRPESFLGWFVIAQMVGTFGANFVGGYVGDRFGGRALTIGATLAFGLLAIATLLATHMVVFLLAFFFLGVGRSLQIIARQTFLFEVLPPERRPTDLATVAFCAMPLTLAYSLGSGALFTWHETLRLNALLALAVLLLSVFAVARLPEPRHVDRGVDYRGSRPAARS